jgi:hypothetical protein
MSTTDATSGRPVSFVTPFRQAAFAVIWTGSLDGAGDFGQPIVVVASLKDVDFGERHG